MTATNNLPLAPLADTVLVNYQGDTRRMLLSVLAEIIGNGGSGPNSSLATEIEARKAADEAIMTNGGRFFTSREVAVAAGQAAIPAIVGFVITRESNGGQLVLRGPLTNTDDPLFTTSPYWGVTSRIDTAAATRDAGVMTLANVGGTANAITAELPPAAKLNGVTSTSGTSIVEIVPTATNTAAPTLTIDGGGPVAIQSEMGAALAAGQLIAGRSYLLRRRGTVWRVISGGVAMADLAAERVARSAEVQAAFDTEAQARVLAVGAEAEARVSGDAAVNSLGAADTAGNRSIVHYANGRQALRQNLDGLDFVPAADQITRTEAKARALGIPLGGAAAERVLRQAATAGDRNIRSGKPLWQYDDGKVIIEQHDDGLDFIPADANVRRTFDRAKMLGLTIDPSGTATAPAGGWDAQVVDGETHFTAHAGPGLIDRFRLVGGVWRPTRREAIICISFGQSQAGFHYSNGEPLPWGSTPPLPWHLLMLNDGASGSGNLGGVRGWQNTTPTRTATALVPARYDQLTQDIATAVGATLAYLEPVPPVVVCRAAGRGGAMLIGTAADQGIYKDSTGALTRPFMQCVADAKQMVQLAEAEGYTVNEIVVPFQHGEADGLAGISRAQYAADFRAMKADFESRVTKPVRWLLTQPASGSGATSGNDWAVRMALYDLGADPGVTLVCPKYDLETGNDQAEPVPDRVHTGNRGRIMLGEYTAHALAEVRAGRRWIVPWATSAVIAGSDIIVTYTADTPLRIDDTDMWVPPERPCGAELIGTTARVVSVERESHLLLRVKCNAPPTGGRLRLAYTDRQPAVQVHDISFYPSGNATIRDGWERPSRWLSGKILRRYAWGQEIQL